MSTRSIICLMVLLTVGLNCSHSNDTQDWENLQKAIADFDNAWDTGDTEKKLEIFAEDGIFLGEGREMVRGTEALRELFESFRQDVKWEHKRDNVKIEMEGKIAYEVVSQITTVTWPGQEPRTIPQKYVHVWQKQNDGSWRVIIDIFNLNERPGESSGTN